MGEASTLLKASEVATRLNVTPQTLYRWAEQGLLPAVRLGGVVRFRPEDVDEFVRKNATTIEAAS